MRVQRKQENEQIKTNKGGQEDNIEKKRKISGMERDLDDITKTVMEEILVKDSEQRQKKKKARDMLDKRTEENRDEKRPKHEDKKINIEEEERQHEEEMEITEEDPPEHETKEINRQRGSEENSHKKDKYKKEIYVLKEGKLVKEESPMHGTQGRIVNKVENKKNRYKQNTKSQYNIIIKIDKKICTNKRGKNQIKILMYLMKLNTKPCDITMVSFNKANVTFDNFKETNRTLDILDKEDKEMYNAYIEERTIKSRGVIIDWEYLIEKLTEAITNKAGILKIERMRRKRWDNTNKKLTEEDTDKLIVTSEGRESIKKIGLYNDLIFLKIRPYVEAVKQCYNSDMDT